MQPMRPHRYNIMHNQSATMLKYEMVLKTALSVPAAKALIQNWQLGLLYNPVDPFIILMDAQNNVGSHNQKATGSCLYKATRENTQILQTLKISTSVQTEVH